MFGYRKEKATNRVLDYWDLSSKPQDTDDFEFVECIESEKPPVYEPEPALIYSPQALKNWAMQQIFTAELIPHFAAFLDFANVATDDAKVLFLTYATAVNLVDTANTIVAKAVELGANITL